MERLKALQELQLLDTLPEKSYDDITNLAAYICDTPISLVTLLDEKRQYFKSHHGLSLQETPIEQSFCTHAITHSDDLYIVEDARKDARFKENPLVTNSPKFVFYAGVPLVNASGNAVGTLCVIDKKPKKLDKRQADTLKSLAQQVMKLFELHQTRMQLQENQKSLTSHSDRLKNIIKATRVGTWEWHVQTGEVNIDERWAEIVGHTLQELQPVIIDTWYTLLHPDDRAYSDQKIKECFERKSDYYDIECRMKHKDGHWVWINDRGSVTAWAEDGRPLVMSGTHTDITTRKHVQIQLDNTLIELKERIKEQSCLYNINNLNNRDLSIDELLRQAAEFLPGGWKYPEITTAKIEYGRQSYATSGHRKTKWTLTAERITIEGKPLKVTVSYHKKRPERAEGPFLVEERQLINSIVENLVLNLNNAVVGKTNQLILQSTDEGIYGIDEKGLCTFMNPAGAKMLGYTVNECLGNNTHRLFHYRREDGRHYPQSECPIYKSRTKQEGCRVENEVYWRKDGSPFYVRYSSTPIIEDGKNVGAVIVFNDTSESRNSQENIRKSREELQRIMDSSLDIICTIDGEGRFVMVGAAVTDILEYATWEMESKSIFEFIYPDDHQKTLIVAEEVLKVKTVKNFENRYVSKSGKIVPILWSTHWDSERQLLYCVGRDVTEKKKAERKLLHREKRFRALVENGADAIVIIGLDGKTSYVSPSISKVLGYTEEEALKLNLFEVVHPEDIPHIAKKMEEVMKKPGVPTPGYTSRTRHKDGSWRWLEATLTNLLHDPAIKGIVDNFRDVTERVIGDRFDSLERSIMERSLDVNFDTQELLQLYLIGLEEIFPDMRASILKVEKGKVYDLASPSLPKKFMRAVSGEPIGPKAGSCGTAAFTKKRVIVSDISADPLWESYKETALEHDLMACWSQPIFDSQKNVVATFANYYKKVKSPSRFEIELIKRASSLVSLILETHQKNQALIASNERYDYVNKATNDAIYDWDALENIYYWGDGFYRNFGYPKVGKVFKLEDWDKMIHPDDFDQDRKAWKTFMADKKNIRWNSEFRLRHADGHYAWVEEIGHLMRDKKGKPLRMIGVLRNISETKLNELQKQFQQQVAGFFRKEESLSAILNSVVRFLTHSSGYNAGEIWLTSSSRKYLNLATTYASDKKGKLFFKNIGTFSKMPFGKGVPGWIWKHEKARVWRRAEISKVTVKKEAFERSGLSSAVGVPLFYGNKVIGVLVMRSDKNITEEETYTKFLKSLDRFLGAEIKRKQQEDELRLFFESAPEILAIASPEGRFTKVNPAFSRLLGYTAEQLTTQPFTKFIHPDDLNNTNAEYTDTITGERQANNFVNRYITKSGEYKWISWSSSDVFGEDNCVFSYGRDVTEMKELQQLLDDASNMARVGSWELSLRKKGKDEMYWSPMTRKILEVAPGYNPSLTGGFEFYEQKSRATIEASVARLIEAGEKFDLELLLTTAKGNPKWVRCIGQSERVNGKCVRIFGSFQDIHERKIAELDLENKTKYLSAIASVITLFLKNEDWRQSLDHCFKIAGEAVAVDRVYYFENHRDPDTEKWLFSQRYEWNSKTTQSRAHRPGLENMPFESYPDFIKPLAEGKPYMAVVSRLPESLTKKELMAQDIFSILVLPLFIDGKYEGFVGFDDCTREREWSADEISFLQAITSNLSSAIQRQNSQAALKEAYEEKNKILESIGDGFFTIEKDFTVSYWNGMAEKLLHTPRKQIIGKNLWDVFSDAVNLPSFTHYKEAMQKNIIVNFEDYYQPIDRWFEVNAYPSEYGLSVYFKDVTTRKLAEEQIRQTNERFEKVAEATNDAIWDWDRVNNTLYWGGGFKKLFGHDVAKTSPSLNTWTEHIHHSDRKKVMQSLNSVIENPVKTNWREEYRFLKADGKFAYVIDRGLVIRDENGKGLRMVGAITDITYRKEYEESLKALNRKLEKHARDLAISNAELEQFAYVASHDLQEPLRMVTSFLSQLQKKYDNQLDEKASQYIYFAVDGAKRMRQIILDLLAFSRVGKNQDNIETIDTEEVIKEICTLLRRRIEEKHAIIEFKDLPKVVSYRSPVMQVFQNLIENALKYAKSDLRPEIKVTAQEHKNEWEFAVNDNGIGIGKDYYEKIFVIFQRLHTSKEYEGTGMGLAIVKKIVENLNGRIWVESKEGEGSTFCFTIPK